MIKECKTCADGVDYEANRGECPKCGDFLRAKSSNGKTPPSKPNAQDDFSTLFDEEFIGSPKPSPIHKKEHQHIDEPKHNYSQPKQQKADNSKSRKEQIEGQVRYFQEDVQESKLVQRWITAFMSGTPLARDQYINSFHVYDSNNNGVEVIVPGKITKGKIADFNIVLVEGVRDTSGPLIASRVVNKNSNTVMQSNIWLSSSSVRFITFLMFAMAAIVLLTIVTTDWTAVGISLTNIVMNIVLQLIQIFLPFIILYFIIFKVLLKR